MIHVGAMHVNETFCCEISCNVCVSGGPPEMLMTMAYPFNFELYSVLVI